MCSSNNQRLQQLIDVLEYDSQLKEKGKAGHFSTMERIRINQERGQLLSGNDNYRHELALKQKIEFVIEKISPQTPEGGVKNSN